MIPMMTSMRNQEKPSELPLKEASVAAILADIIWRETKVDIALVPAATYAANVATDTPTASPLQDDPIVIIELTGVQLQNAMMRSVSYVPKAFGGLLSTAGITTMVSISRDGRARVMSIELLGKRLDLSRRYKVAMPKPLADGQLGYFQIWDKQTARTLTNMTTLGCSRKQNGASPVVASYRVIGQ
jgi:2',3'-cyclic-nucleotide 2'-phosphodiesterase (5'-nucleotidase family)